jgi:hypothetical protein
VLDDVLELVFGVPGAELARVRVHCEGHFGCDVSAPRSRFVGFDQDSKRGASLCLTWISLKRLLMPQ